MVSYERRDYKVSYQNSSVAINSEERAFAVEAYFSSGCSVIATRHAFRNRNLDWLACSLDLSPCVFFLCFFFVIPCLCKPSKNPTRFEDQHPGRNCQHSAFYAGRSHDKCQKSVYSVYDEWGTSPT